jgi:hypothetical protein
MQIIKAPDALPTLPVFSQAVLSDQSQRIYLSGTIGCTKEFKLVEGGVKAQTVSTEYYKNPPIVSDLRHSVPLSKISPKS